MNIGLQKALSGPLMDIAPWFFSDKAFRDWVTRYYGSALVNLKDHYPEWYFNHKLSRIQRNSLLCVQIKMESERLWSHVKTITWIGESGNILFNPDRGASDFQRYLLAHGYGDWWLASWSSKWDWGVRSRLRGCQLHFRGKKDSPEVEAHIDIHNPGDPSPTEISGGIAELPGAVIHSLKDDFGRASTHKPDMIRAALRDQGLVVTSVP